MDQVLTILFQFQEQTESQMVEEKTNELKQELELVNAQVEQLREARRRQETMVSRTN